MTDVLTPAQRKRNMSAIRGKDTKPEMIVRSIAHRLGYRFHLHRRDLPGTPDLVFANQKKIVNVHGCYWHMHTCRWGRVVPKTNAAFWQSKRTGNALRDRRNLRKLRYYGWKALTIWECETRDIEQITQRISKFLSE